MPKKKTHEEFVKEVFELVGEEYTVLGEYKNNKTKIEIIHNKCGFEYKVRPYDFLIKNSRCPKCMGVLPYTTETFKQKIYELVGNEFELLSEYNKNNRNKVLFKHNKCEYEFEMTPHAFLSGQRCPKCAHQIPYTTNLFKEMVYDLVKDEYSVLGEYFNNKEKILMRHNICAHEFYILPSSFLSTGTRCSKCANVLPYTTETFKEKVFELTGEEYSVLGEYISNKNKILMKHNKCGYEYYVAPNNFISQNQRCPKCNGGVRSNIDEFKEKVYNLVNKEYIVLGEYINCSTKILIKHNVCDNEYLVRPSDFLSGCRCPICAESKGERKIRYYLENNNISFKSQYTFNDCKRIDLLPFDFAIFKHNGNLDFLVEYDGEFHYRPVINEQQFKYQRERDEIKNNYCINNDIKLIRIPYWDFDNIESILNNNL